MVLAALATDLVRPNRISTDKSSANNCRGAKPVSKQATPFT